MPRSSNSNRNKRSNSVLVESRPVISVKTPGIRLASQDRTPQNDENLVNLVDVLQKIDTDDSLAKLNEISISDNNGGRIFL